MNSYLIRRLLLVVPTFLISTLLVFIIIRTIPGDVIDLMAAEGESRTNLDRPAIEHMLGLDKPAYVQYFVWLGDLAQGNLGKSYWRGSNVIDEIAFSFPITLELGIIGMVTALIIALPAGALSAVRQDTFIDYTVRGVATLGISIPNFWIGILVVVFPSIWWRWSPAIVYYRISENFWGNVVQFIIPGTILGIALSGTTMRLMRNSMLEVLRQDYIRTAWAKGLTERVVVVRHALRNSIIPVITMIGLELPVLVGGAVVIENIFNLPGVGRLFIDGATHRDYPIITGVMVYISIFVLLINVFIDITYSWIDPRIRL